MPAVNLPFQIVNGAPLDADQVMANEGSIVSVVNGSLEMGANVSSAAPSAAITGKDASEGVSASAMRSDAQFVVQGVENAASDPGTGNFVGRDYYNTVTNQRRLCINTAGSGTWVSMGNPLATELVVHAAQHKPGGHDPLASNTVDETMFAAKTTIFQGTLGANSSAISSSTYTTILDLTTVFTTGIQTLGIIVNLRFNNAHATIDYNAAFRVVDVTASNITIYKSDPIQINHNNQQQQQTGFFFYTTPAAGARTLRVAAGASAGSSVTVLAPNSLNGDSTQAPTIQAVIL